MNPESTQLTSITEVAVLQARTPAQPEEFHTEFAGLGAAFRHPVKVHWLFPEAEHNQNWAAFRWHELDIQPVPFALFQPDQKSGNWEWLQDPFMVVPGPRPSFILPKKAPIQDQLIVTALARSTGAYVRMANTHFEGGNALYWGNKILLGKDTLLHNTELYPDVWDRRDAIEKDLAPGEIVWLGATRARPKDPYQPCSEAFTYQPFFHVDLYLQPAGINGRGNPRIALAKVIPQLTMAEDSAAQILADQLSQQLEDCARQIRSAYGEQVEIIRLPLVLDLAPNRSKVCSPCNGLFERGKSGDRVLLPDYGQGAPDRFWTPLLKQHKRMLEEIWRQEGVQVDWIQNQFFEDIEKCGALHCRVKIIRREMP